MKKGESILTLITILKTKGDTVTKIQIGGREYALVHKDQFKGKKKGG